MFSFKANLEKKKHQSNSLNNIKCEMKTHPSERS